MDEGYPDGEEDLIFNEYAIDDTLDPLQRLVSYYTSDFSLQRVVLIRELADTAKFAGFEETTKTIIPLLNAFVTDSEPAVRLMFVQQLFPLADYCIKTGGEQGLQQLLMIFLPFAVELLVDKNVEVSCTALKSLIELAELVPPQQIESQLLHVIITLAHDDRAEDYRTVAAQLFNELAPKFGAELCTSVVLNEMKLLSNDSTFTVRKVVGANLGKFAATVGPTTAGEKVLPIFLGLCKDESWGVRKACVENSIGISSAVTSEARVKYLVPAFKLLSEDGSRWVRVAAYSIIGKFIHTMKPQDISHIFLKTFTDMAFQSEAGDTDFAEYCAFCFPAVALAIGKERWRELDDAFNTLLKDAQWKVRKSLAHSLHEIAQVVGREIAERSLCRAFELFLRDLDDVKLGAILNVDKFFAVLGPQTREKYIPFICNVPIESENWRLRNVVASKLGDIAQLVSPKVAAGPTADITMKLLDDSVAEVRASTYHSCAQLLLHLHGSAEYESFANQVISISQRPTFQGRQMYSYVFQQIVELNGFSIIQGVLLDHFVALGSDKVTNVRYVVARVLANSCINNKDVSSNPKIQALAKQLQKDSEMDISAMASAQLPRLVSPRQAASYYQT